jgi:two-component system, chemotaxis family, protein-glutamate methylesterase/glutaminase
MNSESIECTGVVPSSAPEPWLIAIAASAGGIRAIGRVLAALPEHLPAAIVVVQHRTKTEKSYLNAILGRSSRMPVVTATEGQPIHPGLVYVARPDLHLMVSPDRHFAHRDGKRIRFVLSSANPLLESAAAAFAGRVIAVVLTGCGSDATDGVQHVKASGGVVIAQDRATSEHRHAGSRGQIRCRRLCPAARGHRADACGHRSRRSDRRCADGDRLNRFDDREQSMSHTHLLFRSEAREKVLRGATAIADAVRVTPGPKSASSYIRTHLVARALRW